MDGKIVISQKEETIMKILHYFVTEEDYKPVIIRGIDNEIWLENFDADFKLIRINVNYIHNNTQFQTDLLKAKTIRKSIKKKTYSFKMNVLNILVDYGESVELSNEENITSIKLGNVEDVKGNSEYLKDYPKLIEELKSDKSDAVDFFKMTEDMNKKSMEEEKTFKRWNNKPSKFNATNIIIAVNIIVFILMYLLGNGSEDSKTLLMFGANYAPLVKMGEAYRVVTSMFIHIGLIHILCNMYALKCIGPEIEKFYGSKKFLIIYLLSGIVGSLVSCVFTPDALSAGASGAIFGLFGSLLYFGTEFRSTLDGILRSPIMPVIVVNLALGFIIPGIDIFAHIGGLVAGYLLSKILGVEGKKKKIQSINTLIIFTILVLFFGYMAIFA